MANTYHIPSTPVEAITLQRLEDELEKGSEQKDILHKKIVDHQAM